MLATCSILKYFFGERLLLLVCCYTTSLQKRSRESKEQGREGRTEASEERRITRKEKSNLLTTFHRYVGTNVCAIGCVTKGTTFALHSAEQLCNCSVATKPFEKLLVVLCLFWRICIPSAPTFRVPDIRFSLFFSSVTFPYNFLSYEQTSTLPGYKTPSTSYRSLRILCFKFVNQMSTGIVSEVSRWLSCVVSMGFFLLWNFGLKTTFISSGALVIYNALKRWRRGSQTFSEILATAVLVLVAIYQVGSKNILLSLFNWTAMPLFHLLTANAYRSLLVHSPTIPSAFALAVPLLQQRSRQALVDYQGTKNSHLFACAMFFETVVTVLFRIYPLHYRSVRAGSRTTITLSLLSFKEWCKHLLQTYGNESRMEEEEAGEENNSITSRRKLLSRARSCLGATFAVFHFGLLQFYLTNVTMRYGLKTSLAVRCLHELELFAFQLCPTLISFSRRSLTQK
ncbi:F-box/LRR-repeat protein 5, variant 4 [Balamuthia mandrillaris]